MVERESGVVWKRSNIPLCRDDEDVWDDSVLIKAYDRAVASIRTDTQPDLPQSKSQRKRRNRASNNRKNKKACVADVQYDYYGNKEKVDMDQLLTIESKDNKKAETSFESQEGSVVEELANEPNEKYSSKQWKVSDICFVRDEDNFFKQAVVNEFITPSKCKVTFTFDHKTAEVAISSLFSPSKVQRMYRASHNKCWSDLRKVMHPGNYLYNNRPVLPSDELEFSEVPKGFNPPMFPSFLTQTNSNKFSTLYNGSIPPPPTNLPPFPSPPLVPEAVRAGDEEALAGMLMSWYMSGYRTGYYQGMRSSDCGTELNKEKTDEFKAKHADIKPDVMSEVETTDGEPSLIEISNVRIEGS